MWDASLDRVPDRFLVADGGAILCAAHGALFGIEDGVCVAGRAWGWDWNRCRLRWWMGC